MSRKKRKYRTVSARIAVWCNGAFFRCNRAVQS